MPAKQPSEVFTAAFDFAAPLAISSANLASGVLLASDKTVTPIATTLAAGPSADDSTISLTAHPGIGARLTINAAGGTAEMVKVSNVSGSGPYTCTINPALAYDHATGEPVSVEPGVSPMLLVSTTATIVGTRAVYRIRRGVHLHNYRVSVIVTLDSADVDEFEVEWAVADD
jgi:hypothetical protein